MTTAIVVRIRYGKWVVLLLAIIGALGSIVIAVRPDRGPALALVTAAYIEGGVAILALFIVRPQLLLDGQTLTIRNPMSTRVIECARIDSIMTGYFGYIRLADRSVIQAWALQIGSWQQSRRAWARADFEAERLARGISEVTGRTVAVDHGSRRPPPPPLPGWPGTPP